MTEAFGIMDEGYFVSRREILNWINSTLDCNQTQIENLGTGIIYCRLLQKIQPGVIPIAKLNLKAKHEYEYTQNLKLLQLGFFRLSIQKKIDIKKLSKCKYQDNLELIQWMKLYIDSKSGIKNGSQTNRNKNGLDVTFNNKSKILGQSNVLNFQSTYSTQIYKNAQNTTRQKRNEHKQNNLNKSQISENKVIVHNKLQKITQALKYQVNTNEKIESIRKILGIQI